MAAAVPRAAEDGREAVDRDAAVFLAVCGVVEGDVEAQVAAGDAVCDDGVAVEVGEAAEQAVMPPAARRITTPAPVRRQMSLRPYRRVTGMF
ncbi:hypothetical protein [Acidipropionibacterium acidipropionici]|jgi:hypothetical protein|uniref:hypothetical protein n=1 Tax=Acidipropionibacterium acidipropionici TaxID=1748 RepID=UPI0039C86EF7